MSETVIAAPDALPERFNSDGPEHCIALRPDGVYADPTVLGTTVLAAVENIFRSGSYFSGLDYPVLLKALYDTGPALPVGRDGQALVRLASEVLPFDQARRGLYRPMRVVGGQAEYSFEPVFLIGPHDEEVPTRLDVDEFIAELWLKGIRFGIDVASVRAAIAAGHSGRMVIAQRLAPSAGEDAAVIEVAAGLHRSNAPRQLANGKLDLSSFENRFPQVQRGTHLLQKLPLRPGLPGYDLAGARIDPEPPRDLDLQDHAGEGTMVERGAGGEFLVATRTGFLNLDPATGRLAIGDKIVSRDGVSAKTTGNLNLTGDYEEFGEVQEKRVIEGSAITVHGDVYGELVSRGGLVKLHANLVGGSVQNQLGDIEVAGVTANAVVQTLSGCVRLQRAENCIVSGTSVRIVQAINCEIIGDDVAIDSAEGCAVAGRRVRIDLCAPWRGSEMRVHALCADCSRIAQMQDDLNTRLGALDADLTRNTAELALLCARPELRSYLALARQVRAAEVQLTPEQTRLFQQRGLAMNAELQQITALAATRKSIEAELAQGQQLRARFADAHSARAGSASVLLGQIAGDTDVRKLAFDPDLGAPYALAPRDIKSRLRANTGVLLHAAASSNYRWPDDSETKLDAGR